MQEVSVIIPNYNGIAYIRECLDALENQSEKDFEVIVVDNGSTDQSAEVVEQEYSKVRLIRLSENYGFCKAVNEGIYASQNPYVLLLNNDTQVDFHFVEEMLKGIKKNKRRFSCAAKMISYRERGQMDDAGNYYNALGWAFARGKGSSIDSFQKDRKIFSSCAGAAIYRKSIMEKIGYFDEAHFAYLEDMDIGYRARIHGYQNIFLSQAIVYHVGSATSGSRYNLFKVRYSSRNNIYMIYKNMPVLQIVWNFPFLVLGFAMKTVFFWKKGFGKEYIAGIKNGFSLSKEGKRENKKVVFQWENLAHYLKIQWELYINIFVRFLG